MNTEQKEQIRRLRKEGYGYSSIAHALRLTKSQVSAYCRRNKLTGRLADTNNVNAPGATYCKCCGKPLTQQPGRKGIKF